MYVELLTLNHELYIEYYEYSFSILESASEKNIYFNNNHFAMSLYTWSCHCGAVKYSVELDLTKPVLECNCSHCQRKGFLLSFVPATDMNLLSGDDAMTEYRFNTHKIRHRFCSVCWVQCFGEGEHGWVATRAINIRTIENLDLSTLTRQAVDGKSF